jgi:tricorn protease
MYDDCLYRFERDLFGYGMDYDAVIIDVRYNGGGYIAEQLFEILGRRPSGMMQRRTGPKHITPAKMYRGVKVCMINQHSFSNAEMFAYGFRELGFGKVVGIPTNGGVIGTRNYPLLDGTMFRIPLTGRFKLDGTNMENNPVEPDVWVQAPLGAVRAEDDPQLRKAVEVALDELR